MEVAISKGVFGSNTNVFTGFRRQANQLQGKDNKFLSSLNSKLNSKIVIPQKPFMDINLLDATKRTWFPIELPGSKKPADRAQGKYKDVPLIVAPGQEDAYLETKARFEAEQKRKAEEAKAKAEAAKAELAKSKAKEDDGQRNETKAANNQVESSSQKPVSNAIDSDGASVTASNGWEQLLQATGLKGMDSTIANLGYVVSMLPDVLVGMLTGNTKTLNMKNTMMPLASILLGMFVRNPILKLALIGFGGANLLNKAGKESIGWQQQTNQSTQQAKNGSYVQPQYRQYADEPLSPRITNPVLQGTTLIANIDRVPCNIQLTENVVAAYRAGALPLNTLANAVLAKYDAQQLAQRQYGQVELQDRQLNQAETIHRTR